MTRTCFVAGSPIAQSRSPMIHGRWIAELGLDAAYVRIEAQPDALPGLLARVRNGEFLGGNLTKPLKEAALPSLDALTDDAAAMGAVNTVFMDQGTLTGANTDVPGFFAHLDETCPGWDRSVDQVLVLGAGGAARAVIYGLLQRRISRILIANRSVARAQALIESFAHLALGSEVGHVPWPVASASLSSSQLVINTTSLGMVGQPALVLNWPDRLDGTIVYDIVYVPLDTELLRQARRRGARTVDGLGMLLHQAAIAFGFWFGGTPQVTPDLWAMVAADITRTTGS
ncbi:MAG: shikimate dehydrogenase [Hyphomicrobiales bacterium]|nr:shikimate dehydrogenase [Hyphomicrobiales bacterium]